MGAPRTPLVNQRKVRPHDGDAVVLVGGFGTIGQPSLRMGLPLLGPTEPSLRSLRQVSRQLVHSSVIERPRRGRARRSSGILRGSRTAVESQPDRLVAKAGDPGAASLASDSLAGGGVTVCARPESALTRRWGIMPVYYSVIFFVGCISGSRLRSAFSVETGAAMIVASAMVSCLSVGSLRVRRCVRRARSRLWQRLLRASLLPFVLPDF